MPIVAVREAAAGESRGGISPPRAPKTVREPLDSHGFRCSASDIEEPPMSKEGWIGAASCARRISIVPLVPNLGCGFLWRQQIMIEFANGLDRRPGFRSDRRLPGRPHPAIELASRAGC